jgi:recombination protein RecA
MKAIDLALTQIEKQFGKGSIMRLGAKDALVPVDIIPTGSMSFDAALGVGGMPRGRVVEIFGPESSGKTTIALHVVAQAQLRGGMAAFVDAEHALDAPYAKRLGVDVDNLLVSQPDYGEQALEIAEALVRSNAIDVLVIDSVAALVPKAELDGDMGGSLPGLQARLMSQALGHRSQIQNLPHFYQPDPGKDRRHVREPGDDQRWPGAEVLCYNSRGHPSYCLYQGWRPRGRKPDQG